jgi:[ribosomal protein S5]-alanine N-acetyltransferase
MSKKIESNNFVLIACNQKILEAAIKGNIELAEEIKVNIDNDWTQFGARAFGFSLEKIKSSNIEKDWWSYLPILKSENKLIGLCGYKGSPDENGMVEIGYEIKSEYNNKGFATEIANALIMDAFKNEKIKLIQAHTLGENNASTSVLIKCGFEKVQDIENSEVGTIWKWELKRANFK